MDGQNSCPVCNRSNRDDLFCEICRSNIWVRRVDIDETEPEGTPRKKFIKYTQQYQELLHLETNYNEQQEHISALQRITDFIRQRMEKYDEDIAIIDQQLHDLNHFTLTFLLHTLTRSKDKKINKLQENREFYVEQRDLFRFHFKQMSSNLELAYQDLTKLQSLMAYQQKLESRIQEINESKASDVFFQRLEDKREEMEKIRPDLNRSAMTYRRLKVARNFMRYALRDLDVLEEFIEGDKKLDPVELLTDHHQVNSGEVDDFSMLKFLSSAIWKNIHSAIMYGFALGEMDVIIPNAGSLNISTLFTDIFPEGQIELSWIRENRDMLRTKMINKSSYLGGMLEIIEAEYRKLQTNLEEQYNQFIKFNLEQVI